MNKFFVFLAFAIFMTGCIQEKSDVRADLGEEFSLKINQTASIPSEKLMLRFVDVAGDSRCPSDVVCVWAGEATVRLEAVKGVQIGTINLTTTNSSAGFAGYEIKLVSLEPYPTTAGISKSDYIARIKVSK